MVQFVRGGPTRASLISDILAPSLGEGLTSFTGNYFANKELQNVLNDKEMANKPTSERLQTLQSKLSKFGDYGEKVLQRHLQVEGKREQEQQAGALSKAFSKMQAGEPISEEEFGKLSPDSQKQLVQGAQQLGLQKQKNIQESDVIKNDIKMADKLAIDAGKPELAGKGYTTKLMTQLLKNKDTLDPKVVAQTSFDTAVDLLKGGKLGLGSGVIGTVFGGKTARDTAHFNSIMGGLESALVDMVSRGTLSNSRFKYITETLLPKSNDRQQVIRGKLEAMAEILGLDPSSLTGSESKNTMQANTPPREGKIRVKNKLTGQTGSITPFEGMENKYERIQ